MAHWSAFTHLKFWHRGIRVFLLVSCISSLLLNVLEYHRVYFLSHCKTNRVWLDHWSKSALQCYTLKHGLWLLDNYLSPKSYFFRNWGKTPLLSTWTSSSKLKLQTWFFYPLQCEPFFSTAYQYTQSLQFVVTQVDNRQPMNSLHWLLIWVSEPDSLPCFLPLPLKPLRVCLLKQIRVYLMKLKRAIWFLILTSNSYRLVSFIDWFWLRVYGGFFQRGDTMFSQGF